MRPRLRKAQINEDIDSPGGALLFAPPAFPCSKPTAKRPTAEPGPNSKPTPKRAAATSRPRTSSTGRAATTATTTEPGANPATARFPLQRPNGPSAEPTKLGPGVFS